MRPGRYGFAQFRLIRIHPQTLGIRNGLSRPIRVCVPQRKDSSGQRRSGIPGDGKFLTGALVDPVPIPLSCDRHSARDLEESRVSEKYVDSSKVNLFSAIPPVREHSKESGSLRQLSPGKQPRRSAQGVRSRRSLGWATSWEISAGAKPALPVSGSHGVPVRFG
jgi:hypothetical protein